MSEDGKLTLTWKIYLTAISITVILYLIFEANIFQNSYYRLPVKLGSTGIGLLSEFEKMHAIEKLIKFISQNQNLAIGRKFSKLLIRNVTS